MTAPPADRMLHLTAALLWAGAAALVGAAVWLPYRLPPPDNTLALVVPATRPATGPAVAFDDLLDLNLRRPPVDPPAQPPTPLTAAAAAVPAVRLAGIVSEPGHAFAVLVMPTGATEVRAVGQRAGPAEVVAISTAAVTVRIAGQLTTLTLPPRTGG